MTLQPRTALSKLPDADTRQGWQLAQARILEQLATGIASDQVFDTLLHSVEQVIPEMRCSVMLLDAQQAKLFCYHQTHRLPKFYLDAINGLNVQAGAGSCGSAAQTGERVVVENIATHPFWADYRDLAARAKLLACWSQPIFSPAREVVGTLGLYYDHVRSPNEFELQLIENAAHLAGILLNRDAREARLRRSETRYRNLVEHAPVCIYETDLDGRLVSINQAGLDMLQANSENQVRGRNYLKLVADQQHKRVTTLFRSACAGKAAHFEFTAINGAMFASSFVPIPDQSGKVNLIMGISEDITERKRSEQALRLAHDELEQRVQTRTAELELANQRLRTHESDLNNVIDASPNAGILTNDAGYIFRVNRQAEKLFGYTRSEMLGQPMEMLLPERFRQQHLLHRRAYAEHPTVREIGSGLELFALHKDGSEFPIDVSLSLVDLSGQHYVSASVRDISERKQQQRTLQKLKEEAERATAVKSRFLAAASHDLRQPLQSISLYLAAMERRLGNELVGEIGTKMRRSLDVMAELLNTLLDISLLESGAVTPEPRDISIHNLLAQIEAANLPHADKKGLRLRVSPADFMVHTDLALLQRIVENFVSNAIRYTDDGEVCVECRQTANGLQIEVRDSGCGIPADRLYSVFDEYVQLDNEAHDRKKGLGLGLAIVKYIARLLDHPLSVTSVAGKGSTFSVTVPLAANPVAVAVKPVAASHQAVNSTAKILLIDDDPMVIDAAMLLLQEEQFEVYAARDGKAALDHIAQGLRPDMIVSDYRLPGQNGIEVVRNIKQMLNSEPVIIFMTGDSSIRKIHEAKIENGHVLQKPVNSEKLMTLIRRSLV